MVGSVTSVFGEPDDFQAALRAEGVLRLLVTAPGEFRARLTQVALHDLHLLLGEERLPRIALVATPEDKLFVALPLDDQSAPIFDGFEAPPDELLTFGPGQPVYTRIRGPCRWGALTVSRALFVQYGRALCGAEFAVPPASRWRPRRGAMRQLRRLHRMVCRTRSGMLADGEAAHGLEQQLIHALVDCLFGEPIEEGKDAFRDRALIAQFEDHLENEPLHGVDEIASRFGVSLPALRDCCEKHLGIDPERYRRLRNMQLANRALRTENPDTTTVSQVAERYGFKDLDQFSADYFSVYGESPSARLRRGADEVWLRRYSRNVTEPSSS
jgi:AraC-like DNA-binding protein